MTARDMAWCYREQFLEGVRMGSGTTRRSVLKLPAAAAVMSLMRGSALGATGQHGVLAEDSAQNLKIAIKVIVAGLADEELLFLKQIGLRWVHADFGTAVTFDEMRQAQERFASYGMTIDCGLMQAYRSPKIQLGLPGRDEEIARFNRFLSDCGRLKIRTAHIDFHPGNTYDTAEIVTPRGYTAREFSVADFRAKLDKPKFEKSYSTDEIWANYTYFIKAVLPAAENAGVKLALHPDDPPITPMNAVAKVFIDYAGYHRAEEIAAGSKSWGLCLCLGTWLEGGAHVGKSAVDMIRDFGARGKIHTVHFRSVSGPLPVFHETLLDDGYQDMYLLVKALREVKCDASFIPDHYPALSGDKGNRVVIAYSVAMMRMMLRRANEEVG